MELKNGFYETDDDCMQFCRELGNQRYLFIQAIPAGICISSGKESSDMEDEPRYFVAAANIDVSELSREDIDAAIYGFYKSISEMEEAYDADISQLMQLVAECMFENIPDHSGYDYISEPVTWEMAEQRIQSFIEKYPEELGSDLFCRNNCDQNENHDKQEGT